MEDISDSGGDLLNGAQHACLSTGSRMVLSSLLGPGVFFLDRTAQLITAMHCYCTRFVMEPNDYKILSYRANFHLIDGPRIQNCRARRVSVSRPGD